MHAIFDVRPYVRNHGKLVRPSFFSVSSCGIYVSQLRRSIFPRTISTWKDVDSKLECAALHTCRGFCGNKSMNIPNYKALTVKLTGKRISQGDAPWEASALYINLTYSLQTDRTDCVEAVTLAVNVMCWPGLVSRYGQASCALHASILVYA